MLRNDLQTITNLLNEVDAWKNSNLTAYANTDLYSVSFHVNGQPVVLNWDPSSGDWNIATR